MSVQELADFLDVPVKTIYAWRYHGEGPRGFRIGRHVRFRWHDGVIRRASSEPRTSSARPTQSGTSSVSSRTSFEVAMPTQDSAELGLPTGLPNGNRPGPTSVR